MKYISKELAKELKEKIKILESKDPLDKIMVCKKNVGKKLSYTAMVESFMLEHPEYRFKGFPKKFSIPRNKNRAHISKGIKCLKNAFEWGSKNFEPESFDEEFIKDLAYRITPELYIGETASYRNAGTMIMGARVIPPNPFKIEEIEIPNFVESLRRQLKNNNHINKIESAIYTHLHLARIHPFIDGNGRTARTLQDIILYRRGIPLPIIYTGERHTYYDMIDHAVYDFKHKKQSGEIKNGATEGESMFYTFMAGKINNSLDNLIKCISRR